MNTLNKQRGAILPLVTISLLALFALSGLVVDIGHSYVEKTRLQNMLDGAALRGAYVLNMTNDQNQAKNAAKDTFNRAVAASGNAELAPLVNSSNIVFSFPVINGPAGTTTLIKLVYTGLTINATFSRVVGVNTLSIGASSAAGAVPLGQNVCNVVPIVMCGDATKAPSENNPNAFYGYTVGTYMSMKMTSWKSDAIGPGNFGLLNLTGTGGSSVRENMAGGGGCVNLSSSESVNTQTGNVAGPTAQGMNTRFGEYKGGLSPTDYPQDWITTSSSSYTYSQYKSEYQNINTSNPPTGKPNRRILVVPIGDCSQVPKAGSTTVPVLTFGCFFIREKLDSNNAEVKGEFTGGCAAEGSPGNGKFGTGPYKIVLYRDTTSLDS